MDAKTAASTPLDELEKKLSLRQQRRSHRVKTVKLKTLLIIILVIFTIFMLGLACLYYLGTSTAANVMPASPMTAPKFLFNIYEGKTRLSRPVSVIAGRDGRIYISSNNTHTLEVLAPNGRAEFSFGGAGRSKGQLLFPYGIGLLPEGGMLVSETGNLRLQEFSAEGKFVREFLTPKNSIGLIKPGPLHLDSQGRVFVGDLSGHQVLVLDRKGRVLHRIKDIHYPHGLAFDEKRQRLYVADSTQLSIQVFSLEGQKAVKTGEIKGWGQDRRFSMVRGLAVDNLGRLYVADTVSSAVRVIDQNGDYLFSFGRQGFEDGEFLYPYGIYADNTGKVYVSDWGNDRVQVWGY